MISISRQLCSFSTAQSLTPISRDVVYVHQSVAHAIRPPDGSRLGTSEAVRDTPGSTYAMTGDALHEEIVREPVSCLRRQEQASEDLMVFRLARWLPVGPSVLNLAAVVCIHFLTFWPGNYYGGMPV
ncbi:hypothetical protein C8R43DRAFT_1121526 [Mycena crocata]|nr:hypothetical protein C8R43DRAFT_1121526 [Mycena crocata]